MQKSENSQLENSGQMTPKEFEDQLAQLNGQTPGNVEEAGGLVGVIGQIEVDIGQNENLQLPNIQDHLKNDDE